MEGDLTCGGEHTIHRWCIIKVYTWNLYNFINQWHPNKCNKKEQEGFLLCISQCLPQSLLWVELWPPERYVDISAPSTSEWDIIWKLVLCRGNQLSWGHTLMQYDWCPYKKRAVCRQTHRENALEDWVRYWNLQGNNRHCHQEARERHATDSPSKPSEVTNTVKTLNSDFYLPELWDNKFLFF